MLLRRALTIAAVLLPGCALAGPRHRTPAHAIPSPATRAVAVSSEPRPSAGDEAASATDVVSTTEDAPHVGASVSVPPTPVFIESGDRSTPTFAYATAGTPALTYAALDDAACLAMLKKRGIPYTNAAPAVGVGAPIRFTGSLHGVRIHGIGSAKSLATSVHEIVDCRLALALDDFTAILAKHEVVEAIHMSIYRPAPRASAKQRSRHEAALAIDLGSLVRKDGSYLSVLDDWHGAIGAKTCGPGVAPVPATQKARELRAILCDAYDANLFNVVLTPNYNKPHQNHFHLEVTRGVKWLIVH